MHPGLFAALSLSWANPPQAELRHPQRDWGLRPGALGCVSVRSVHAEMSGCGLRCPEAISAIFSLRNGVSSSWKLLSLPCMVFVKNTTPNLDLGLFGEAQAHLGPAWHGAPVPSKVLGTQDLAPVQQAFHALGVLRPLPSGFFGPHPLAWGLGQERRQPEVNLRFLQAMGQAERLMLAPLDPARAGGFRCTGPGCFA